MSCKLLVCNYGRGFAPVDKCYKSVELTASQYYQLLAYARLSYDSSRKLSSFCKQSAINPHSNPDFSAMSEYNAIKGGKLVLKGESSS